MFRAEQAWPQTAHQRAVLGFAITSNPLHFVVLISSIPFLNVSACLTIGAGARYAEGSENPDGKRRFGMSILLVLLSVDKRLQSPYA